MKNPVSYILVRPGLLKLSALICVNLRFRAIEAVGCVAIKNLCIKIDFSTSDAPAPLALQIGKYIVAIIIRNEISQVSYLLKYNQ